MLWRILQTQTEKILISGGADSTVRVWNTDTGELLHTLEDEENNGSVVDVAFSPDGKMFGSTSPTEENAQVWNAHTLRPLHSFSTYGTYLAFSSDSKWVAVSNSVWDVNTGEVVGIVRPSSGWPITSIAFSSDVSHLLSVLVLSGCRGGM